ncbi:related to dityrosine transporter [Phialocephala subalpina]|uniref:Related to dityrosine transporter n=1 Tax=Phialocephala subalpina TaxID=576137 RepID=A0A1L7X9X1_9HELO|nr:related to dityrosine transporter [Phialocephala subalpina]
MAEKDSNPDIVESNEPDVTVGNDLQDTDTSDRPEPPHSIFPKWQRVLYVYMASLAAFSSPVASSIYYPAMLTLARDLNTSLTNISLTITTYLIFQGVAPTIVGGFSDRYGRRPAYFLSFTLFIAANIGLALQTNFVALLILRMVQSCGSSGTTALSSAVVADVATRQQRGSYIGLAALGSSMGPALGPLIGGLLNQFLGWRSIFWFLTIYGGVMLLVYVLFMPETCRNIVGNGSIPPQSWNRPLFALHKATPTEAESSSSGRSSKKRPGLLSSIPILFEKESFLLLFYGGLMYAGFMIIITGLPQQLATTYNYNSLQVGLCYLPIGFGPLLIRPVIGRIMDANFRRHARKLGVEIHENRQQDISDFPVERARLEISLAFVYLSSASIIPYGWVMTLKHPPLAAVLVCLFLMGLCTSAAFQPLVALVIDINPRTPAASSAAFNLVRCLLAGGGVAVVNLMLDSLGRGWTSTLVAFIWVGMSVCWWAVIIFGPRWRKEKKAKSDA